MSNDKPVDGRCNAKTDDGGYCEGWPSVDENGEVIDGKCSIHRVDDWPGGAPKGNSNASTHNLYADRSNYYHRLDREDQLWIDLLVESFLEDAPFDRENLGKLEQLRQVAIDMHKIRTANEYIWNEGLAQLKTIDFDENSGEEIEAEVENILNLPVDRLQRQVTKRLKELGVLEDPQSQLADSNATLAEVLSGVEDSTSE